MKTKICTDIEQSKKLIELGIDINTADMWYLPVKHNEETLYELVTSESLTRGIIPCWSLTALLDVLPILNNRSPVIPKTFDGKYRVTYHSTAYEKAILTSDYDNPIDACYEIILKLHELNLL